MSKAQKGTFLSLQVDYNKSINKSENLENFTRTVFRQSEGTSLHTLVKIVDGNLEFGFSG